MPRYDRDEIDGWIQDSGGDEEDPLWRVEAAVRWAIIGWLHLGLIGTIIAAAA